MSTTDLDRLTRQQTAFRSFREMLDETAADYRPSLHAGPLQRAYDAEMQRRGDKRRAYVVGVPR